MIERTLIFALNTEEFKRLEAFKKRHKKFVGKGQQSTYTYHFTPTGIGTKIEVENNTTKVVADITDYDSW